MQENIAKKKYLNILQKWCSLSSYSQLQSYYQTFQKKIQQEFDISITFDDRIVGAIYLMFKKTNCLQFSPQQQYTSAYKSQIIKISHILYKRKFIGKRELFAIENHSKKYLLALFQSFLSEYDLLKENKSQLTKQMIAKLWSKHVQSHFLDCWEYIMNKKIYHNQIMRLLLVCRPVIKWYKPQFQKQIQIFQKKAIQYLLSQSIESRINKKLDTYVTENSFFLQQNLLKTALNQIYVLFQTIKLSNKNFSHATYQIYGSFRSGFALLNQSDADINLLIEGMHTQLSRRDQISILNQIIQSLKDQIRPLNKFITLKLYSYQKIPVPFLKVQYNDIQYKNILSSIDIVVNSHKGVQNSNVLKMYSKSIPVLKLCNLVKLWAKKKSLINLRRPMQGFSSYGIILMVLFYLIQTKQVPSMRIVGINTYELSGPLSQETKFKSLLQNFKGWLKFYNVDGQFFRRKMTVCLVQKYEIDQNLQDLYLVNMYDPIDNTNPGRMQKRLSFIFFDLIEQALRILSDQEDFDKLFTNNK